MNKQEFFDYLNKRLEILDPKEREDILAEFDQHINNKIENGAAEADAIADFGDPEEFVEEILEAYKVNPDYANTKETNSNQNKIGQFLKNFGSAVNAIADSFFQKSKRELFLIFFKFLIICGILWLIKLPLDVILHSILNVFNPLPGIIYSVIDTVIRFIYNLAYLLLVCYSIYLFVAKYFLSDRDQQNSEHHSNNNDSFHKSSKSKKTKKQSENARKENDFVSEEKRDSAYSSEEKALVAADSAEQKSDKSILSEIKAKGYQFRQNKEEKKENYNGDSTLINLLTICLKVLIVFCMIPFVIYALANFFGLFVSFIMIFMGLPTLGITIAALGSLLCVSVFVIFIFKVVFFDNKTKKNN